MFFGVIKVLSGIFCLMLGIYVDVSVIAVDNLLNETELEIVVYTGQLDLIVDTLGR